MLRHGGRVTGRERAAVGLTTAYVFVGACLLFGVEPLVGRLLLPFFGGAAHVWLTCMVLFQALLLSGYAWAHLVAPRIGVGHLALLAAPLAVLPLSLTAAPGADAPLLAVAGAVLRSVGLPFLAMSTVSVTAQLWLARSPLGSRVSPWPLYAASNAGSLFALLAYPLAVEPLFGLGAQRWAWSAGYVLLVALGAGSWALLRPASAASARAGSPPTPPPEWRAVAWWVVLGAVPSGFLLATTNVIASEVGSFPLVWVVPLALYLGSFMLVFRDGGGVPRWLAAIWPEVLAAIAVLSVFGVANLWLVAGHAAGLLAVAVLLHGELYERRPAADHLTSFYLWMSLGGLIGGLGVTFAGPLLFRGMWEYPLLVAATVGTLAACRGRALRTAIDEATFGVLALRATGFSLALSIVAMGAYLSVEQLLGDLERYRTFYGLFRVREVVEPKSGHRVREIVHGVTLHGSQVLDDELGRVPAAYYHPTQCIAQAIGQPPSPRRLAIVGLGAGGLAGFAREGDTVDFFEIDPDNEATARRWFTWLERVPGERVRVHVGDGRLLLAGSSDTFEYVQIDAFSGDGIPSHLLTREALETYGRRLAPGGILMLHVSNRYYDLRPTVKATAALDGWSGAFAGPLPVVDPLSMPALCVALARDPAPLQGLVDLGWRRFGAGDGLPEVSAWTDDYVNLLEPMLVR